MNSFRSVLVLLGVFTLAAPELQARPLARVRKEGLTVAVRPGPLPFGAAAGAQRGLDVDLVTAIAEGLGVRYRITEIASFPEAQSLLAADKIDLIIGGVRSSPELKTSNLVTAPYYKSGLGILALRSNRELYTLSDLDGRPVAATPESGADKLLESFLPKARLELVPSLQEGLDLLQKGEVHAVVGDQATLGQIQLKTPAFRLLDVSLTQDEFVLLANRNSASLVEAINEQLRVMRTVRSTVDASDLATLCARYNLPETVGKIVKSGAAPPKQQPPPPADSKAPSDPAALEARVRALENAVQELREKFQAAPR